MDSTKNAGDQCSEIEGNIRQKWQHWQYSKTRISPQYFSHDNLLCMENKFIVMYKPGYNPAEYRVMGRDLYLVYLSIVSIRQIPKRRHQ